MSLITDLPSIVLDIIVSYLDGISTLMLGSTCIYFYNITSKDKVWRDLSVRTRIIVVTKEVELVTKGNKKAIFFLCHRLRRNWAEGRMKETLLCGGGVHYKYNISARNLCVVMAGEQTI